MLRIIAGIESPDSGTVMTRRSGLKVALVEQVPDLGSDGATALSACRWEDPDAATRMLSQLGISDPAVRLWPAHVGRTAQACGHSPCSPP